MIVHSMDVKYFMGVVEDRNDPMKLGRVKVRVYSLHPFQKHDDEISGLPTEDLLWMFVIQPISSASISGVGTTPVGVMRGTHVFGLYLDKYYLNGVVLGTYGGVNSDKANTNYGFSDPLGVYPKNAGSDIDNLSKGGLSGSSDATVSIQNRNLDIGVNPSGDSSDIYPDDNPNYSELEMLERDEGVKNKLYWDTLGYPTIGIGHLIINEKTRDMNRISKALSDKVGRQVHDEISLEEVSFIFKDDLKRTEQELKEHSFLGPIYNKQNKSRKMALLNMAFQLGINGLSKFRQAMNALDRGEYKEVGYHLRDSLWYNQTLGRATRVIRVFEAGNMESYGVMVATRSTFSMQSNSPEDPFTPTDSRIMFKEPKSPYKGEYPFNKVQTTEGGHIFEVDDTPGHERIKNQHTSGTYEEIGPSGEKVTKVVADNYTLIHGNDHILVEGDVKLVVSKNSNIYIMGDSNLTIDGNVNQIIRGNSTSLIEGNSTETIRGNLEALIEGDVTSEIKGNVSQTIQGDVTSEIRGNLVESVQGDVTRTINGSYNLNVQGPITQSTASDWNRTSGGAVYDIASAIFTINGSRINIG